MSSTPGDKSQPFCDFLSARAVDMSWAVNIPGSVSMMILFNGAIIALPSCTI